MWLTGLEVVNAGPNASSGKVEILLRAGAGGPFQERWFLAADGARREMLATALAAMSSAKAVNVETEGPQEMATITKLLMSKHDIEQP